MNKQSKTYTTNLPKMTTSVPVSQFLKSEPVPHRRIAGLLDYGYSYQQIAGMLSIPLADVMRIANSYGYKTIDLQTLLTKDEA